MISFLLFLLLHLLLLIQQFLCIVSIGFLVGFTGEQGSFQCHQNDTQVQKNGIVLDIHEIQLFVCGFSMETKDLIENSTAKLHKKNMDMIVANNVKVPGAGFGVDTNVVTLITESISTALPLQSKDDVAMHIADVIVEAKRRKQKK